MAAPEGARRTGKNQSRIAGLAREGLAILWDGSRGVARKKIPWETAPISGERTKRTVINALSETYNWLKKEPDLGEELQTIFGDSGLPSSSELNLQLIGKGWNSIAYSFDSNGKKWVIKLGAFTSPHNAFFPPPSTEGHSRELIQNLEIIREGLRQEDINLPDFVSLPQVIHYARFPNSGGRRIGRTINIVPFENIVPLEKVAEEVRSNPETVGEQLRKDFEEYVKLRRWMIKNHRSDFDLHGEDNVAIVNVGDDEHPSYRIRLMDIGLRIHGLNTPAADLAFDVVGTINATALRRAILGRNPYQKGEDRADFIEKYIKDFVEEGLIMSEGARERRHARKEYFARILASARRIFRSESDSDAKTA